MTAFDWFVVGVIIITVVYVSFALTLRDWLVGLQKGEAVTLLPQRGGRPWPMWTQVGVMVLGLVLSVPFFYYLWIPLAAISRPARLALTLSGLPAYLAGLAFMLWARRTLGRNWGLSTSTQVSLLRDHQLVQSGPYAYVRHPMYLGWWVSMLGLTLIYPVWAVLLLLLFSVISFLGRARREEAALSERFGPAWAAYRSHTKFLIPFIY